LVQLGPDKAVAHLLDYENIPDPTANPAWAKPDPNRRERVTAMRKASEEERRQMQREERQNQRST